MGPTIYVRGGSTHLWYSGIHNNFPIDWEDHLNNPLGETNNFSIGCSGILFDFLRCGCKDASYRLHLLHLQLNMFFYLLCFFFFSVKIFGILHPLDNPILLTKSENTSSLILVLFSYSEEKGGVGVLDR